MTSQQNGTNAENQAAPWEDAYDVNPGITLGWVLAAIGFVVCLWISLGVEHNWLDFMLCFFGAAAGWFVGILIAPTKPGQRELFASYGKAILTFVSGFLLAKVDRIFEAFLAGKPAPADAETVAISILLFATTFVLGTLTTFAGRGFGIGAVADSSAAAVQGSPAAPGGPKA